METGISGKQELGVHTAATVVSMVGSDFRFSHVCHMENQKVNTTHTRQRLGLSAAVLSVLLLLHDGEMTLQ